MDRLQAPLRRYRLASWQERRTVVIERLVGSILPAGTPFIFDAALSWLQVDPKQLAYPSRVALFVPDYRLVVDVLTPADSPDYLQARPYLDKQSWEQRQGEAARKKLLLSDYGCPYLLVDPHQPIDTFSLSERLRPLLGAPL